MKPLRRADALQRLGIQPGDDAEDEAAVVVAGAARLPLGDVREALRPFAGGYVMARPLTVTLIERGALGEAAARFAAGLDGARTLRTLIDAGARDLGPEPAARLLWALLAAEAASATVDPPLDAPTPLARRTARLRAHLRARAQLRGQSAWRVLEVEPGVPPGEVDGAAGMLALVFAPERAAGMDLGELAPLVALVAQHIDAARQALVDPARRAAHDLRFPRPAGEEVRLRRADADEAAAIFVRGQQALLAGDVFKAVSELAAAARRCPDEPDYEAYAAWARLLAEARRGEGDLVATARRERRNLEDTLWGRRPRPRTLYALARLCEAAGDVPLARLHLQDALIMDPRFAAAQSALARLPPEPAPAPPPVATGGA